ncbi:hypothetical protein CY34DRAFT_802211 [Suillus luteus UH-Slu-Lm8-n1]|uniref:Guanine nucleotide-binding protein subunit beta-like protein n=1 Tax=Suillus luteus UH-Slu-Lm8-n1 TaxID=930992 RepID=A0A0D0BFG5_9AGAM|nr:hypothetical protein CY34DRAFT_802211 [Suillus luteus UH-Slu-Lm8-n1]
MSRLIPSIRPIRDFKGHQRTVNAVAVFPDKRRMVTASWDKTLRLWDLETGANQSKPTPTLVPVGSTRWIFLTCCSHVPDLIRCDS